MQGSALSVHAHRAVSQAVRQAGHRHLARAGRHGDSCSGWIGTDLLHLLPSDDDAPRGMETSARCNGRRFGCAGRRESKRLPIVPRRRALQLNSTLGLCGLGSPSDWMPSLVRRDGGAPRRRVCANPVPGLPRRFSSYCRPAVRTARRLEVKQPLAGTTIRRHPDRRVSFRSPAPEPMQPLTRVHPKPSRKSLHLSDLR